MKKDYIKYLQIIVFLIVFLVINKAISFAITPAGKYSRWMMHEMYGQKENIDLVFAGSSQMYWSLDPKVFDEELGINSFNTASSAQCFQGTYYVLNEMFKNNSPKYVLWNMDQLSFMIDEDAMVYLSLAPYMRSIDSKLGYYLATAKDGQYLDKIFPWRGYRISGNGSILYNIKENVTEKLSKEYKEYDYKLVTSDDQAYRGKGYVYADPQQKVLDVNKIGSVKTVEYDPTKWKKSDIEYFKKIVQLCKEHNAKLIMINPPYAPHNRLNFVGYEEWNDAVNELAEECGIQYYDFNYIKPELLTIKSEYFFDQIHMNGKGATEFSKAVAKFLQLLDKGEDVDHLFYSNEEYYQSVDYIVNTFFSAKDKGNQIVIKAYSYHGSLVTPEYQLALIDKATGEEKIIQEYNTTEKFAIDKPMLEEYILKLYAREKGNDKAYTCYYEKEMK